MDIEICTDIELPYFYVAGATSRKIFEVRLGSNIMSRSCTLPSSPTCMAIDQSQDTILIGTLEETEIVSTAGGSLHARTIDHFRKIRAIETIPNDTTLCVVFDEDTTGEATCILNYFPWIVGQPMWTRTADLDGNIHYICAGSDGSYVYILTYLGDNISRVVAYNCSNYFIESHVDLEGFPLDIEISPGGTLLVLTAE